MNPRNVLLLLGALSASCAFGQLVAIGVNSGVKTQFDAAIIGQDLLITVDNTIAPATDPHGSVTAFGFNTPWAAALDLRKVSISYQVLSSTGPTRSWNPLTPFTLTAGLGRGGVTVDLGLESDRNRNPNGNSARNGVEFGEVVQFKFSFNAATYAMPEYEDVADFFNQNPDGPDFLVRWQDVTGSRCETSDAFGGDFPGGFDEPQGEVPEPSTYGLLGGAALLGAVILRRRKK